MGLEAEAYGPTSAKWQTTRGFELLSLLELRPEQRVLDLGCGSGELTTELARHVGNCGHVVGIDPNEERIRVARFRYGDSHNLDFAVGTNEDIQKYRPLDRVFSNFVMNWIENQRRCFKQVFEVLKPGGLFGVLLVAGSPLFLHKLTKVMAGPEVDLYEMMDWHFQTIDGWGELAEEAGFRVKHSGQYVAYNAHPSLKHLLLWWEATTSGRCLVENTNEEELDQLLDEFNFNRNHPIEFQENIIRIVMQKPRLPKC